MSAHALTIGDAGFSPAVVFVAFVNYDNYENYVNYVQQM